MKRAKGLKEQIVRFNSALNLDDPAVCAELKRAGLLKEAIELQEAAEVTKRLRVICLELKEITSEAAQEGVSLARRVIMQSRADSLVNQYNALLKTVDFEATKRIGQKLDRLGFYVQ